MQLLDRRSRKQKALQEEAQLLPTAAPGRPVEFRVVAAVARVRAAEILQRLGACRHGERIWRPGACGKGGLRHASSRGEPAIGSTGTTNCRSGALSLLRPFRVDSSTDVCLPWSPSATPTPTRPLACKPMHQAMSQPVPVPGREQAIGGGIGRTLEEHYELLDVLGRGSFSVVHRARHRQTNEMFACKVIDKWSIHNRQRLANEVRTRVARAFAAQCPSAPTRAVAGEWHVSWSAALHQGVQCGTNALARGWWGLSRSHDDLPSFRADFSAWRPSAPQCPRVLTGHLAPCSAPARCGPPCAHLPRLLWPRRSRCCSA